MALSIPLPILLGLIVGGLGGTLAALHLIGWSTPETLETAQKARDRFALDYPEDTVTDVILANDSHTALLALADGSVGLVAVLGDRFVVRRLGPQGLTALRIDPQNLQLQLPDIGYPRAVIALPDTPERAPWVARLSACVSTALAS